MSWVDTEAEVAANALELEYRDVTPWFSSTCD